MGWQAGYAERDCVIRIVPGMARPEELLPKDPPGPMVDYDRPRPSNYCDRTAVWFAFSDSTRGILALLGGKSGGVEPNFGGN